MAHFAEMLKGLLGKYVTFGRGGPDRRGGYLVAIGKDYLSLSTEDGTLVHYQLRHIKSLREAADKGDSTPTQETRVEGEFAALPESFWDVVQSLRGQNVQVNDHGPECAVGFLSECGEDYLKLTTNSDETVYYLACHIRSIRAAQKREDNRKESDTDQDHDKDKGHEEGKAKDEGKAKHEGKAKDEGKEPGRGQPPDRNEDDQTEGPEWEGQQ